VKRADAAEAVRRHISASASDRIEARRPVHSTAFDVMKIAMGQVGKWE
jgi:hypothetical protein